MSPSPSVLEPAGLLGPQGHWGPPTASVDFCEANYAISPYFCELANSLSSLAMLAAGVLGLWLHQGRLELRFRLAFLAICLVGIGSVLFHATLRFEHQMLDELPMLYLALVMVFIVMEDRPTRRFGSWFPSLLCLHGAFVTALAVSTRGDVEFWAFQISFGSLEFFGLYRVWRISQKSGSSAIRSLFRWGMSAYLFAILVWFVDIRFCPSLLSLRAWGLPNPQLHALWHLLVSAGFYLLVVLLIYSRQLTVGAVPRLERWGGFVPFVTPAPGDDAIRTSAPHEVQI